MSEDFNHAESEHHARNEGKTEEEAAAGTVAAESLQAVGASAKDALGAAGGLLGSLASRAKASRAASTSTAKVDSSFEDSLEKVKQLKELLDCGILTQEEFDAKKCKLLGL